MLFQLQIYELMPESYAGYHPGKFGLTFK